MSEKNPIEQRIEQLREQWTDFAQSDARLLRWRVEPAEVRMIEAFLAVEGDDRAGECPDLFLRLEVPFLDPGTYGHALRLALEAQVEESREALGQAGFPAMWKCPPLPEGASDVVAFLAVAASLHTEFAEWCEHLVLVLMPARIQDVAQWSRWLAEAVSQASMPHVRLVVLDDVQAPALEVLARAEPAWVQTVVAKLDMARALEQVSRQAGHLELPGGKFRELMVRMGNAAASGHLGAVERLGQKAEALALAQGWNGLRVAVAFVVGGALLGAQKPQAAAERYRHAVAAAAEAEARGEREGTALKLKARLALAAALVAAGSYADAAVEYEDTAGLAEQQHDAQMELESWRMAGWCQEQEKKLDQAWAHGMRAWQVGASLSKAARASSSIAYVADSLLRIAAVRGTESSGLEEDFSRLLGPSWRQALSAAKDGSL